MALIDPTKYERIEIPDEPGAWVEIRPRIIGDLVGIGDGPGSGFEALARQIRAWSFDEPVSAEAIACLELPTYNFLTTYRVRPVAEKKDSDSASSQPTDPAAADGLVSSAT